MKHTSQVVDYSTFAFDMFTQILTAFLSSLASQIAPGRLKFKPASFFCIKKKQELGLKKTCSNGWKITKKKNIYIYIYIQKTNESWNSKTVTLTIRSFTINRNWNSLKHGVLHLQGCTISKGKKSSQIIFQLYINRRFVLCIYLQNIQLPVRCWFVASFVVVF